MGPDLLCWEAYLAMWPSSLMSLEIQKVTQYFNTFLSALILLSLVSLFIYELSLHWLTLTSQALPLVVISELCPLLPIPYWSFPTDQRLTGCLLLP